MTNSEKRRAMAIQEARDRELIADAARSILSDPEATSTEKLRAAELLYERLYK